MPGTAQAQVDATQNMVPALQNGTDPSSSTLVDSNASTDVWLIPGSSQACLVVLRTGDLAVGEACTTPAKLTTVGLLDVYDGTVVALVPPGSGPIDITTSSGTSSSVSTNGNGAVITKPSAGSVSQVQFRPTSGATQTLNP